MIKSFYHFGIGEIELFVDISLASFNFANMWFQYMANISASLVTQTHCASCL